MPDHRFTEFFSRAPMYDTMSTSYCTIDKVGFRRRSTLKVGTRAYCTIGIYTDLVGTFHRNVYSVITF